MNDIDYSKCQVCGLDLGPDRLKIVIDNGRIFRHTHAHRRHRYVEVQVGSRTKIATRTDLEIESLAHAFRAGELAVGWE